MARYNRDGSVDTIFGSGGKVVTEIGDAGATPLSILIQPDGKIVAATAGAAAALLIALELRILLRRSNPDSPPPARALPAEFTDQPCM